MIGGSLLGGVIGATIGFIVGGVPGAQVGWVLGSGYGASFDSLPPQEGPRLGDLKAQTSEYGRPIPIIYGTVGTGGNVIWAADVIETKTVTTSGGGWFTPKQSTTTYSYFADFSVLFAEGPKEVLRIWAGPERRLIYDGLKTEGGTIRVYTGTDTQLPDSLIESYLGAGNVPAYRGYCYVVFEKFPLANDGNRIPLIFAEVGGLGTNPPRVATYLGAAAGVPAYQPARAVYDPINQNIWSYAWTSTTLTVSVNSDITQTQVAAFSITLDALGYFDLPAIVFRPGSPNTVWIGGKGGLLNDYFIEFNADALSLIAKYQSTYVGSAGLRSAVYDPVNNALLWARNGGNVTVNAEIGSTTSFSVGPGFGTFSIGQILVGSTYLVGYSTSSGSNNRIFVHRLSDYSSVSYWAADVAYGQIAVDEAYTTVGWITGSSPTSVSIKIRNFLTNAETSHTFTFVAAPAGDTTPVQSTNPYSLNFAGNKWRVTCVGAASLGKATTIFTLNRTSLVAESAFTYSGESSTGNYDKLVPYSIWPEGKPYLIAFDQSSVKRLYFASGAGGQTLSAVVADLSDRSGLTISQYDTSALTDIVDGYAIARQTSVRSAIDALRPAYYFDAVESEGLVKFVKRGGAIAATVPDEDLAAVSSGDAPDPLQTTRQMEQELPRAVYVNYLLAATNYQAATKYSNRLVGSSGNETTIDTPLVLTDTKAQAMSQVNLTLAWVSRQTFRFNLPPKYSFLEPTDIVVVKNRTMRITRMTRTQDGVFECEAVADDSNFYSPSVVATETTTSGQTVATLGETTLILA